MFNAILDLICLSGEGKVELDNLVILPFDPVVPFSHFCALYQLHTFCFCCVYFDWLGDATLHDPVQSVLN